MLGVGALLWLAVAQEIAARAATGLGSHLLGGAAVLAIQGPITLFLVVLGLQALRRRLTIGSLREEVGLLQRPTAGREWALGLAVAWGAVILSVLPLMLFRSLDVTFWLGWRGWVATLCSIVGAVAASLAVEMVYRAFAFAHLSRGVGRAWGAVILTVIYGAVYGRQGPHGFLVSCALAALLLAGWLRTHALWMSWGLHLGWALSLGLVFGLPLSDGGDLSGLILAQVKGSATRFPPQGPSGMIWTALVIVAAVVFLIWVTKDYAWQYTHPRIVAGGFPMEATPPPAHVAMQQEGASRSASSLVQIAPATPGIRTDVRVTNEDSV